MHSKSEIFYRNLGTSQLLGWPVNILLRFLKLGFLPFKRKIRSFYRKKLSIIFQKVYINLQDFSFTNIAKKIKSTQTRLQKVANFCLPNQKIELKNSFKYTLIASEVTYTQNLNCIIFNYGKQTSVKNSLRNTCSVSGYLPRRDDSSLETRHGFV